jgi:plasmid stabilization system protein ParE
VQIVLLSESEEDILAAHDWYELKRANLGSDFELCIEAALDRILLFPESFPKKIHGVRVAVLHHFPYGIYYMIMDDTVIVVGVFHFKRNPKNTSAFISKRLKNG